MPKKMLILTGPQGAGNHLWSKIFSLHPEVFGWETLLDNYWEAHRFHEPFCKCWRNHDLLHKFDWSQSDYFFTSISAPLGIFNYDKNPIWNPDIIGFAKTIKELDIDVDFAIIGRDQNILQYQQKRIRGESTLPIFLDQLEKICTNYNPKFLSYELLYIYKAEYLRSLNFNIPVAYDSMHIDKILENDANTKYVHGIPISPLDNGNRLGIVFKENPLENKEN